MINKNLRTPLIIIAVICIGGIGLGFWYSQLDVHHPERSQEACEQSWGEWQADEETCILSSRQAGEACVDGGQCQSGVCFPPDLTEEQQAIIDADNEVSDLTGSCYPEELVRDCVKQVLNGTVNQESLCLEY
ncbi:hypothetical protein KKI23_00565 [Patescibacteria group bacterium]|nr:hypothetical protein [Patescibacteria group bacterium]